VHEHSTFSMYQSTLRIFVIDYMYTELCKKCVLLELLSNFSKTVGDGSVV